MKTRQLIQWRRMSVCFVVPTMFVVILTAIASGQTLTGTVTDATTKKPSAGDEIVLLDFSTGMREVNRTQSDSRGRFTLSVDDAKKPRIFQVIHQEASYYKVMPPGTSEVQLEVYDVSKKLKDIAVTADVMRVQVKGDSLQAVRLFAVKNNSSPPQTQMSDHNFEFYLPEGAQIDHCMARSAGGEPVRTFPLPEKEKNRYAFVFPLRPGETQLQVLFHMPYKGQVTINPRPLYRVEHVVVMLPNEMHFAAGPGAIFQMMRDPRQNDAVVQVASKITVGQLLTFTLSGAGVLAEPKAENAGRDQPPNTTTSGKTVRDSPTVAAMLPGTPRRDRAVKSQWYVLGGIGVLLAAATVSIARRLAKRSVPQSVQSEIQDNSFVAQAILRPSDGDASILNDLKEQLFRLEVEHKQNRISRPEYEEALAALRHNLDWAVARKAPGS